MRGRTVALLAIPTLFFLSATLDLPQHRDEARKCLQETAALKALQTLNTAQVQYNSQFGRYAQSFGELGPSASNLIPEDLAGGEKRGYKYTLSATPQGYCIQATPTVFGATGSRTFYTDQSLRIRQNYSREPATANSKEVGSGS
jgi:type IV pilus assembly protein PilA